MSWLAYSVISGMGVNAQNVVRLVMNNMIGICAKVNVNAVEKRSRNNTIGKVANVLGAEKQETRGILLKLFQINAKRSVLPVEKWRMLPTHGRVANVQSVVKAAMKVICLNLLMAIAQKSVQFVVERNLHIIGKMVHAQNVGEL